MSTGYERTAAVVVGREALPGEPRVIILAKHDDLHALAVAAEIQTISNSSAAVLSVSRYPQDWYLTQSIGVAGGLDWIIHAKELDIGSDQLTGVWLREVIAPRISPRIKIKKVRRFGRNEAAAALSGWLLSLGQNVVNPLAAQDTADRKPYQLFVAGKVGLSIPKTVVTNNPAVANEFISRLDGQVIFKGLTKPGCQFIETRLFQRAHFSKLKAVEFAPVIFQEAVEAIADIRVTIIDDTVFSVSIAPQNRRARYDWRLDIASSKIEPHALPKRIERKLISFMRILALRYGAIDMRLTPSGDYIFLEVNTHGVFLFCEIEAGQQISQALARALLRRREAL